MRGKSDSTAAVEAHLRPRILAAGPLAIFQLAEAVLGTEATIVFAYTIEQAMLHVESGVSLILCSERFDESRMFNFLHDLKESESTRAVPVICCRVGDAPLSARAHQTITVALEALGVPDFIDIAQLRRNHAAGVAEEVLRALVAKRLGASDELKPQAVD